MPVDDCCPNCGADLAADARSCPECGSCEETGWSEGAYLDRLGLPSEEFDYEEYVERELRGKGVKKGGRRRPLVLVGVGLLLVVLLLWFFFMAGL